MAVDNNLHDCRFSLTHDYAVEIPFLRAGNRLTITRTDFKQWNGTILESISDLGPQVEFNLRCKEGSIRTTKQNRYEKPEKPIPEYKHEEEVDRR